MNKLKMLTIQDVSTILNTHRDTIRKLIDWGVLRPTKIGRCYMFSQLEIERFQSEFIGLDVSNQFNAMKSIDIVKQRKLCNDDYNNFKTEDKQ